jgi:hypothetical protein
MGARKIILAVLIAISSAQSGLVQTPPPAPAESVETKDRLSPDIMEDLVRAPVTLASDGKFAQARAAFERQLEATDDGLARADLLTSFGVELYNAHLVMAHFEDQGSLANALAQESLVYLHRSIAAYEKVFGRRHPLVALALHSYADALEELSKEPPPEVVEYLKQAYQIRLETLGSNNDETVANGFSLLRRGVPAASTHPKEFDALLARAAQDFEVAKGPKRSEFLPRFLSAYTSAAVRFLLAGQRKEAFRLRIFALESIAGQLDESPELCLSVVVDNSEWADAARQVGLSARETETNLDPITAALLSQCAIP